MIFGIRDLYVSLKRSAKEKEIITKRYNYKKGDTMNMKYTLDDRDVSLSVELAEVTTKRVVGLENHYYNGGYLVLNQEYYNEQARVPYILMFKSSNAEQLVKDIELIDYNLSISNIENSAQAERAMLLVISIFLYGFIGVITLIGVTNIFNTITSNMELRQKEFAMLKSIGMTKKEFNRMINLETLFYSSKSLCYGIILGLIGSYIIHWAFSKNTESSFSLPLTLHVKNNKNKHGLYAITLPLKSEGTIENMYDQSKYDTALKSIVYRNIFSGLIIDYADFITKHAKIELSNIVNTFDSNEFENFRPLFDIIKEIKSL